MTTNEYHKNYREKNRKWLNIYRREYYQKNKDKVKVWNKKHYEKRKRKREIEISHLTESQRTIFFNLRRINKMKNNGHTWNEIANVLEMHRDTLMRALRSGVFEYEKKYILKLKEVKQ